MPVYLAPTFGAGYQAFDTSGLPLNGGFISTFAAGTATPLSTWTTSTGLVANPTSIQLGTDGRPPNEIWLTGATTYLFQVFTSTGVSIKSYDNLYGINDPSVVGTNASALWAVAAGTVNAITASYTPANAALTDGLILGIRTSGAPTGTNPTFSPDGLTAHTITKLGGQATFVNEWGTNWEVLLRYNLANTRWEMLSAAKSQQPTVTVLSTPGIGTYTTPAGAIRLYVRLVGAGGGGAAATANNGSSGGNTTFSTMSAQGGNGGIAGGNPSVGGSSAGGDINVFGGDGGASATASSSASPGGQGGASAFGGGGRGIQGAQGGIGQAPGSGGAGGGGAAGNAVGGGGAAGGYCEKLIANPAGTANFSTGTGGLPGAAGTVAGAAGANGIIIIHEFYG